MGEARLAFATGAFKACQKCARHALEFADDEASRAEAAQLETQAVSQTGSFLGLSRSVTTGLLLMSAPDLLAPFLSAMP